MNSLPSNLYNETACRILRFIVARKCGTEQNPTVLGNVRFWLEQKQNPASALCYQTHPKQPHRPIFYVSSLPGQLGKDWGYTTKPEGVRHYDPELRDFRAYDAAKPLSPYWQNRFRVHCEKTAMTFHSLPYTAPAASE